MTETKNQGYVKPDLGDGMTPVCVYDKQHGHYAGNVEGKGFQAVKPKIAKDPHKPF